MNLKLRSENMLTEGKKAPAFSLKDRTGESYELKDLLDKYTVIFFYPKDNTPGCTIEAAGFQKLAKDFLKLGTTVVGISGGDEKSKQKFCEKNKLSIPMLSDSDFKVSEKYGVYGEKKFMGRTFNGIHRVTFLLDSEGKIIKVFNPVKPKDHPKEVLGCIKAY